LKNFPGVLPRTPLKGKGGKEGRKGKEGIWDTDGEEGVVWDREGEEGIRVTQRKGMGREEKGRKEGGKR
jgi:hypothetical protein